MSILRSVLRSASRLASSSGGLDYDTGIFVDADRGDDADSGAWHAPVQSLATAASKAATFGNGAKVYLARGATWTGERLDLSTLTGVRVEAYGTGVLPTIDTRETVATGDMSKTGGRTNVYQFDWTPARGEKVAPSLWEDGARMTRVSSVATCDSTPGSYYASTTYSDGVAAPVYFHPTASDDPTSSGTVYKQVSLLNAIEIGDSATIKNVRCIAAQDDNGVVVAGRFASLTGVVAVDGTKHHIFTGSGTCTDCDAVDGDRTFSIWGGSGGIAFIGYNTAQEADPLVWRGCRVIGPDGASMAGIQGFYCHGQSGVNFGDVQLVDCEGYWLEILVTGAAYANSLTITNSYAYNCARFIGNSVTTEDDAATISKSEWYLDATTGASYYGLFRPNSATDISLTVEDTVMCVGGTAATTNGCNPVWSSVTGTTGTLAFTRSIVAVDADGLGGAIRYNLAGIRVDNAADNDVTVNSCLFSGWGLGSTAYHVQVGDDLGQTYSGDGNVFYAASGGRIKANGGDYTSATLYLADGDPEPNSVATTTAQFSGAPFSREYDLAEGVDAETLGAYPVGWTQKHSGLTGPESYTAVVAEVAAL